MENEALSLGHSSEGLEVSNEKIIEEEIAPVLEDVNFSGIDSTAIKEVANEMIPVMNEFKMAKAERAELIGIVKENLEKSGEYIEQIPSVEVVQGLVSFVTTGKHDHFVTYVPEKKTSETLKSLKEYAKIVKERTALANLKKDINLG